MLTARDVTSGMLFVRAISRPLSSRAILKHTAVLLVILMHKAGCQGHIEALSFPIRPYGGISRAVRDILQHRVVC